MLLKHKQVLKQYNREYQRKYYAKIKQNKDTESTINIEIGTQNLPLPVIDFIKWNKYMTYVCVDIRDL
jgi:hypothetical protein